MRRRHFLKGAGAVAGASAASLLLDPSPSNAVDAAARNPGPAESSSNTASFLAPQPEQQTASYASSGEVPVFEPAPPPPVRADPVRTMHGRSLDGWETAVGDGIHAAEGETAVVHTDIATDHQGAKSVLRANVRKRAVMAHNITFRRVVDENALDHFHHATFEFRLTRIPTRDDVSSSAQTFESGFFIWDGGRSRREHGLGFQWLLNPWHRDYGWVQRWSQSERGWEKAGYLAPDTEWHSAAFALDPTNRLAVACLDDYCVDRVYTELPKPSDWGSETAARFQAEIISLDPGANTTAPEHRVEVRNWLWEWSPTITA